MTVYGMDLESYEKYEHGDNTYLIDLKGLLDPKPTEAELARDASYEKVLEIKADDLDQTRRLPTGYDYRLFKFKHAEQIVEFIKDAEANGKDVVVHCNAGVSRTGAVVYLSYKLLGLPTVKVVINDAGKVFKTPVNDENFESTYAPNGQWMTYLRLATIPMDDDDVDDIED